MNEETKTVIDLPEEDNNTVRSLSEVWKPLFLIISEQRRPQELANFDR